MGLNEELRWAMAIVNIITVLGSWSLKSIMVTKPYGSQHIANSRNELKSPLAKLIDLRSRLAHCWVLARDV